MRRFKSWQLLIGLFLLSGRLNAGHIPVDYNVPFVNQSIKVDGVLDDQAWSKAQKVTLEYENQPGENIAAKVSTTAYYFEDGENLYIGFDAKDPEPEKIRAYFNDRDASWNDDQVSIMIDTFNDKRRGYQFFVNPFGVQSDSIIDDVVGYEDVSWDAIWDSAGHINDDGYTVEFVIPLRAIRFSEDLEHQIWGIEFIRFYPREFRYRFSSLTRERGSPCTLCELQQIEGFSEVKESNNLDMIPTVTLAKSETRDDIGTRKWDSTGLDSDVGMDVRWGINQDLYLNATFNPDFSQVEADAAQLDVNTTFSLFFPEKRTFFLDGSDYFKSPNNLIHTRNIADPDYGIKLTGKTGQHAYGIILANDTQTSFLVPSSRGSSIQELEGQESDVLISRWRKDVGDKNSLGALVTHREGGLYRNSVYSVDSKFWLADSDVIQLQVMSSDTRASESGSLQNHKDQAFTLNYEHSERNWRWYVDHLNFGKDFRADLGFIGQVDFEKSIFGLQRKWYFDNGSFLNHINIVSDYDFTKQQDGQKLEEEFEIWLNMSGEKQFEGWFGGGRRERLVSTSFELEFTPPGTDVTLPNYEPVYHSFELEDYFYETFISTGAFFRPAANLRVGMRARFGDQVDVHNVQLGSLHEFSPEFEWQLNENIKTSINHVRSWLDVDNGELYKARLTDFRFSYQFDIRSRLKVSVQHLNLTRSPDLFNERYRVVDDLSNYMFEDIDTTFKTLALQLIYSYKVNPQTLVFLGYSSKGYQDDSVSRVKEDQRSFFAKFSYAFQI